MKTIEPVRTAAMAAIKRIQEDWGSLNWLASRPIGNARDLTLGFVVIKPGMSNPVHRHMGSEEILYLLQGKLCHSIEDQQYAMQAGDTISIPIGAAHQAINIGDKDAEMVVAYPTGNRDFQPV